MVHDMNFGQPHQITYWTGDFIPTFLGLARVPLREEVNKLHVFLNHRELVYAVAHMLGMPIQFPGQRPDSLPSGCSLLMEVYDHGVRAFFWSPSQPSHEDKARYLQETRCRPKIVRQRGGESGIGVTCTLLVLAEHMHMRSLR